MLERWREITGHTLLERYGMTEIGMALSNPLHGERRPGYVGARCRASSSPGRRRRRAGPAGTAGEIEVRGPSVFLEYWRRPEATREAFRDGWFRTGDVAVLDHGVYRILGRTSVDIIKTGGYKVSALEIEEVLRTHPAIADCAVVGVEDAEWGERVSRCRRAPAAAAVRSTSCSTGRASQLAPYKVPRDLRCRRRPAAQRHGQGDQACRSRLVRAAKSGRVTISEKRPRRRSGAARGAGVGPRAFN